LDAGYTPLLTPPALSDDSLPINVDGDRAAAKTAAALGAADLVVLSNVRGLLADKSDPASRIDRLKASDLQSAIAAYAEGRMKIKLLAAAEALQSGVQRVCIGGAKSAAPIRGALAGDATVIE
jgi:acetylglutamate/LysW-gamma-L-alpha-aminoadipate kinase